MPSGSAPNQMQAEAAQQSTSQASTGAIQQLTSSRHEKVDEVTAAKLALLNLQREPRDPTALVRKHPLATTGVAFALGLLIGKSPTARALGRAGIAMGMRGAIARAIREVI